MAEALAEGSFSEPDMVLGGESAPAVVWGAKEPSVRGPIVATLSQPEQRRLRSRRRPYARRKGHCERARRDACTLGALLDLRRARADAGEHHNRNRAVEELALVGVARVRRAAGAATDTVISSTLATLPPYGISGNWSFGSSGTKGTHCPGFNCTGRLTRAFELLLALPPRPLGFD